MAQETQVALAQFLERSHTVSPRQVPQLVSGTARRLGMASASVYLADVQEDQLVPLPCPGQDEGEPMAIEGTVAGWAYRTMSSHLSHRRPLSVWLPLVDGIARIGVLHVAADQITPEMLDGATQLAAVTALTVVSKSGFSDLFSRTARQRPAGAGGYDGGQVCGHGDRSLAAGSPVSGGSACASWGARGRAAPFVAGQSRHKGSAGA
ncbi:hypothetical protein ACWCXH_39005 [Kitasatospora sp. NPDC001660]